MYIPVSVVIPTYNSQNTIKDCVQAILNQKKIPDEIIVVDDGSTDHTKNVLRDFKNIRYIYKKNEGPASARNCGAREAKNEIIFFTDADCLAHDDWIEKAVAHLNSEEIAVVCGSYGIVNRKSILARCIYKEIKFRHQYLVSDYPKVFGSYNFGIRKKTFNEVGGFNEKYRRASGEDNDLSYKIIDKGYKIYFERNALVDHYHPEKILNYLKEQYRHGFWRVLIYRNHVKMSKGDEYTFLKDIIEMPLVFLFIISLFAAPILGSMFFKVVVSVFFIMELFYGFRITKNLLESLFLAIIMLVRSFARFFGFSVGIFSKNTFNTNV